MNKGEFEHEVHNCNAKAAVTFNAEGPSHIVLPKGLKHAIFYPDMPAEGVFTAWPVFLTPEGPKLGTRVRITSHKGVKTLMAKLV